MELGVPLCPPGGRISFFPLESAPGSSELVCKSAVRNTIASLAKHNNPNSPSPSVRGYLNIRGETVGDVSYIAEASAVKACIEAGAVKGAAADPGEQLLHGIWKALTRDFLTSCQVDGGGEAPLEYGPACVYGPGQTHQVHSHGAGRFSDMDPGAFQLCLVRLSEAAATGFTLLEGSRDPGCTYLQPHLTISFHDSIAQGEMLDEAACTDGSLVAAHYRWLHGAGELTAGSSSRKLIGADGLTVTVMFYVNSKYNKQGDSWNEHMKGRHAAWCGGGKFEEVFGQALRACQNSSVDLTSPSQQLLERLVSSRLSCMSYKQQRTAASWLRERMAPYEGDANSAHTTSAEVLQAEQVRRGGG